MNKTDQLNNRHTLPRWRSINEHLWNTDSLPFLTPNNRLSVEEQDYSYYIAALSEWQKEHSLFNAVELISQSRMLGLSDDTVVSDYIRNCVLQNPQLPKIILEFIGNDCQVETSPTNMQIAKCKKQVIDHPLNALIWVELARNYMINGQFVKCEKALTIANQLAPNNRYILRCFARFFYHIGEYGKALDVLRRSAIINFDPWVIASEIAISSSLKVKSRNVSLAKRLLQSKNIHPFSLSELASEIATLEGYAGNIKNSKKLFSQALEKANENSFAQAIWASKILVPLDFEKLCSMQIEDAYEGHVYCGIYTHDDWYQIIRHNISWHKFQPFSSRPISFGSLIYDDLLNDYRSAINLCEEGLKSNYKDFGIHNNLAYSYILNGQGAEAKQVIEQYLSSFKTDREHQFYMAMQGMYEMRFGDIDIGKVFYLKAMNIEKQNQYARISQNGFSSSVLLYYLRERKLIGEDIHKEAIELHKKIKDNILLNALFSAFKLDAD